MSASNNKTDDKDWRLICETCGKDLGAFDKNNPEHKKHLGHRHHMVINPESKRWN